MRLLIVGIVLVSNVAAAKEFQVTDQEQGNILAICDLAAQSPSVTRDVRANIANFCVAWQRRIEASSGSQVLPPVTPKDDEK